MTFLNEKTKGTPSSSIQLIAEDTAPKCTPAFQEPSEKESKLENLAITCEQAENLLAHSSETLSAFLGTLKQVLINQKNVGTQKSIQDMESSLARTSRSLVKVADAIDCFSAEAIIFAENFGPTA